MDIQKCATEIVKKLKHAGYTAYFAGGWVRDHLLHRQSCDIDIATDAPPPVILDLFPNTILVGLSFGVVIVIMHGLQFEVATFRRDLSYKDGRKPEAIELSTPKEDAYRRDFTINGMFYDPLEETIYDYVGGVADLKLGIIRTIGDPNERFIEDRLRMIRAVRFACRFGFAIATETQEAIAENANTLFPAVAMERIWQEFNKMSQTPNFDHAIIEMHRLNLLPAILPKLEHVHLNQIKQLVASFAHFPKNCPAILYLLALFPNATLEEALDLCQYMRMGKQEMALARLVIRCRHLVENFASSKGVDWVHFYANPHAQMVFEADAATRPPEIYHSLLEKHYFRRKMYQTHILRAANRTPLVSAEHLMKKGITAGKHMGELLKKAECLTIDYDLQTPEEAMNKLFETL